MPKYFNTSISSLTYRLRCFKDILNQELKDEILKHEDVIISMVVESQLYDLGITGQGKEIASYAPYAPSTIKYKKKKNQPTTRVTLKDSGDFYKSLRVVFDNNGFYITSSDDIAPLLIKKYGSTILRLSDENLKRLLNEYIRPGLREKLKSTLQNG